MHMCPIDRPPVKLKRESSLFANTTIANDDTIIVIYNTFSISAQINSKEYIEIKDFMYKFHIGLYCKRE